MLQGEYSVKLEMSNCTVEDKGTYKLIAKNEKGEAQSQTVTIVEIPQGSAPVIKEQLKSVVSVLSCSFNLMHLVLNCQKLQSQRRILITAIRNTSSPHYENANKKDLQT